MGHIMKAAKIHYLKYLSIVFVLFMAIESKALPALRLSKSHQSIDCTSIHSSSLGELADLIHKVNVFSEDGKDPREVQRRDGESRVFSAVVGVAPAQPIPHPDKIDEKTGEPLMITGASATGFMVSPCYALTNYHVVFGGSKAPNKDDFKMSVYVKTNEDKKGYAMTEASPVVWGDYNKSGHVKDDWALVKLNVCAGKQTGWFNMATLGSGVIDPQSLSMAGYPGDKDAQKLWIDKKCSMRNWDQNIGVWSHDCASRAGASGSPIFAFDQKGVPQLVAMNAASNSSSEEILTKYESAHANLAVPVENFFDKIFDFISSDIKSYGSGNPARTFSQAQVENKEI